jgi:transposase-like protein
MPSNYPAEMRRQVVDLARSGTRVAQLSQTFGMTEATIYNWINQEKIDRGEPTGIEPRTRRGRSGAALRARTHLGRQPAKPPSRPTPISASSSRATRIRLPGEAEPPVP